MTEDEYNIEIAKINKQADNLNALLDKLTFKDIKTCDEYFNQIETQDPDLFECLMDEDGASYEDIITTANEAMNNMAYILNNRFIEIRDFCEKENIGFWGYKESRRTEY